MRLCHVNLDDWKFLDHVRDCEPDEAEDEDDQDELDDFHDDIDWVEDA